MPVRKELVWKRCGLPPVPGAMAARGDRAQQQAHVVGEIRRLTGRGDRGRAGRFATAISRPKQRGGDDGHAILPAVGLAAGRDDDLVEQLVAQLALEPAQMPDRLLGRHRGELHLDGDDSAVHVLDDEVGLVFAGECPEVVDGRLRSLRVDADRKRHQRLEQRPEQASGLGLQRLCPLAEPPALTGCPAGAVSGFRPEDRRTYVRMPDSNGPPKPPEAGYELAYQEAQRGLEDQERTVVELRARAGTLIAAAAISTSFFGGQTLLQHHLGTSGWIAIGCFVLLGFAVLLILWPRHDWEFSLGPSEFIATYLEPNDGDPLGIHLIQRDLALHMGRSAELNRQQLRTLMMLFRLGALLLMAEVLAWVLALIING